MVFMKDDIIQVKTDMVSMKDDIAQIKQDSAITRTAVNSLLEWADDSSMHETPLLKRHKS